MKKCSDALTFLGGAALVLAAASPIASASAPVPDPSAESAAVPVSAAHIPPPAPEPAPGPGPAPASAPAPSLSIAIDDGRTTTKPGETNGYTIHLRNTGTSDLHGLALTQTLPAGLVLLSATPAPKTVQNQLGWTVDVPGGQEILVHVDTKVGTLPAKSERLASIACAAESEQAAPVVCAAHTDLLPEAEAARRAAVNAHHGLHGSTLQNTLLFGVPALIGLGAGVWGYILRRRQEAAEAAGE